MEGEEMNEQNEKKLIEQVAEVQHEAWMHWSKTIAETELLISIDRVERWKKLWVPYTQLSEEDKEHDRKWARKVLEIIKNFKENGSYLFIGTKEE